MPRYFRLREIIRWGLRLMAMALFAGSATAQAREAETCAATADQVAASYDYVLGTQAFGGANQLAGDGSLLGQARIIRALGSNVIKLSLGRRQAAKHGLMDAARNARSELEYVDASPELKTILDMDFTYYQFWIETFTGSEWRDGVTPDEARRYYREVFDLTAWLLRRYSGTGKVFLLGNWEGDWLLNGGQGKQATPSPQAIKGMIDWLNIRQKAIDDARAATRHDRVQVYQYVEVNLVKRAIEGKPSVALSVLPETNVDLVSYSSYEAIKQSQVPDLDSIRMPLTRVVRYLEGQLKPKPGLPFAHRVFLGEFGYHANRNKPLTIEQQYLKSRYVMQVAIELELPFALIWQLYNNEYSPDGTSQEMSLIDEAGHKRALYFLLQQYLGSMRGFVADNCRKSGAPPMRDAFRAKALDVLTSLSFAKMQRMAKAAAPGD